MQEHTTELALRKKLLLFLLKIVLVVFFLNMVISQCQKQKILFVLYPCFTEIAVATEGELKKEKTQDHSESSLLDKEETGRAQADAATSHNEEKGKATKYPIWQDFCALFLAILLFTVAYAIIKRKATRPSKE